MWLPLNMDFHGEQTKQFLHNFNRLVAMIGPQQGEGQGGAPTLRIFESYKTMCQKTNLLLLSVSVANSLLLNTTATKALLGCESEIRTKMDRNQPILSHNIR